MSRTRAPRHSKEEQLRLVNECRVSGLSDAEWCKQHDICISTFYAWVRRLRKEACEIPEPTYGHALTESPKQDVVKVDIHPDLPEPAILPVQERAADLHLDNSHTIEITISDISIRIKNDADPMLLVQTIRALQGGFSC